MQRSLESMRRRLWIGALLPALALVIGCAARAPASAPVSASESAPPLATSAPQVAAPPASSALHFAWPVPGRVGVTQRAERKGHASTLHYFLYVTQGPGGDTLEVRFKDFKFLDLAGQDMSSPEVQAALEQVRSYVAVIPTIVVSPEGEYMGVRGLDEMIDKVLSGGLTKQKDPKKAAAVALAMKSPESKAQIEAKCGDYWNSWVGQWKNLTLAPGETGTSEVQIRLPGGGFASSPVLFEHHGATPGEPGLVRLSTSALLEGDAARAALGAYMKQISPDDNIVIERLRRVMRSSIDTDPLTLMPRRVRLESVLEIKVAGAAATKSRQLDEYEFDWPR